MDIVTALWGRELARVYTVSRCTAYPIKGKQVVLTRLLRSSMGEPISLLLKLPGLPTIQPEPWIVKSQIPVKIDLSALTAPEIEAIAKRHMIAVV
jgi:hypothetical protein